MKYIAVDQYGSTHKLKTKHPRKEFLEMFGYSTAHKMYNDDENGTRHVGYVIGGLWLTLYKVEAYNA